MPSSPRRSAGPRRVKRAKPAVAGPWPDASGPACVLSVNSGSSSIRFALYATGSGLTHLFNGKIDRVGLAGTTFQVDSGRSGPALHRPLRAAEHRAAVDFLLSWLEGLAAFPRIAAVGHRVVQGLRHVRPARVTPRLLAELRGLRAYDPEHLPHELGLIEAFRRRHPRLLQVACFDTAFHRTLPRVAKLLPIPRRYAARGVERYGFHGLSYSYLQEELGRVDAAAARGRVILAHLGSGASLAAVRLGQSIDTSMGFTPAAGLVMGTRSGDLDPGLLAYLARTEKMTPARFSRMVNHESGLLGVSGTSSDLRVLLARERTDPRAAEAIALFCYQARKWIGAYAAALGGLDTLVFSGGIGENAPLIRRRICHGLGFLGIALDARRNLRNSARISTAASRVTVRVIPTDEEVMVARAVSGFLPLGAEVRNGNRRRPPVRANSRPMNQKTT